MSHTIDTFEHAGLTVRIVGEEYVDESYDPRECDQLGTMLCWHPDYTLGDEQFTHDDFPEARSMQDVGAAIKRDREPIAMLALYLYDHAGISISCRNFAETIDPGGWDTTAIGFIYTTAERVEQLCGAADYVPADYEGTSEEWLHEQLRAEVKEYDLYLTGDAGGYVIERDGEQLESCWGFLGLWGENAHVRSEAKADAEACRKRIEAENSEREFWAARDVITLSR